MNNMENLSLALRVLLTKSTPRNHPGLVLPRERPPDLYEANLTIGLALFGQEKPLAPFPFLSRSARV